MCRLWQHSTQLCNRVMAIVASGVFQTVIVSIQSNLEQSRACHGQLRGVDGEAPGRTNESPPLTPACGAVSSSIPAAQGLLCQAANRDQGCERVGRNHQLLAWCKAPLGGGVLVSDLAGSLGVTCVRHLVVLNPLAARTRVVMTV